MKFIIALAAIVAVVSAVPTLELLKAEEWVNFKATHNKQYPSVEEELKRVQIFNDHLVAIAEHNKLYDAGLSTYQQGVTQFTDLTPEEFLAYVNRYNISAMPRPEPRDVYQPPVGEVLAASVDWRDKGAVTVIKDQGNCGSCWSFSATGSLEGQYYLKKGSLVSLSEQNLVDCSSAYGNEACDGGLMDSAFEYIRDHGIESEANYPYKGKKQTCAFSSSKSVTTLSRYTDISSATSLVSAANSVGPISVAIDATTKLQNYKSGILDDTTCSTRSLNHGVLLVGYTDDAYIVKNSWGTSWGENGYFRYNRKTPNICGIASMASYPTI